MTPAIPGPAPHAAPLLILFGCPGSGKGTWAETLKDKGYTHIGLGNLLRKEAAEETDLGREIRRCVNGGHLIADHLAFEIVAKALNSDFPKGKPILLEGFPSTLPQYETLLKFLEKCNKISDTAMVLLKCPEEVALVRIKHRLTCASCLKVYNIITKPPKIQDVCDVCCNGLFARPEDNLADAKRRIQTFQEKTLPIVELAKKRFKVVEINACKPFTEPLKDIAISQAQ